MNRRRSRFAPEISPAKEVLESRVVLSPIGHHPGAQVAAHPGPKAPTRMTLQESPTTIGQPITFTVTVRAPARAGSPQGTVELSDHGQPLGSATLEPTTSTNRRFAYSEATYTLSAAPGSSSYFLGKHRVDATFVPGGPFARSRAHTTFDVTSPPLTALSDGVQLATLTPGRGPAIKPGQTASVLYTGYLVATGQIFDDSAMHGGTPLEFKLGSGQVIPGFDAGISGMKAGETRLLIIPPSAGYGSTQTGTIPANSTLVFVLTLKSIS